LKIIWPDQIRDRVKGVRLRGEISSGIIIPKHLVPDFEDIEVGVDVSEILGIHKYEPPIPEELLGDVSIIEMNNIGTHDCEQVGIYINDLIKGERVVISEKLHGTQIVMVHNIETDETILSSKGLLKTGLSINESDSNKYWIAANNVDLVNLIKSNFKSGVVQIFAELIPIQPGYGYGQEEPTIRIFDIRLNSESIPYDKVPTDFSKIWVPIIYDGTLNLEEKEVILHEDEEKGIRKVKINNVLPKEIISFSKGMELVSGKGLHIKEGVVISPYIDRFAMDGTRLRLKVINPKYKETGDEIN